MNMPVNPEKAGISKKVSLWRRVCRWNSLGLDPKNRMAYDLVRKIINDNSENKKDLFSYLFGSKHHKRAVKPKYSEFTGLIKPAVKDFIKKDRSKNPPEKRIKLSVTDLSIKVHNVFSHIVRKGIDLGIWNFLTAPGFARALKKPSPLGTPETFYLAEQAQLWSKALSKKPVDISAKQQLGDFLCSFIFFGGIANTNGLVDLLRKITLGEIFFGRKVSWVTFNMQGIHSPHYQERRLFLNDMTLPAAQIFTDSLAKSDDGELPKLIQNILKHRRPEKVILSCIKSSLASRKVEKNQLPNRLSNVLLAQQILMDLKLPPVVTSVASGRLKNHALKEECFRSILSVDSSGLTAQVLSGKDDTFDEVENEYSEGFMSVLALDQLRACYAKNPSKKQLLNRLQKWLEQNIKAPEVVRLLAGWQEELARRSLTNPKGAVPGTLYGQLGTIAAALVEYAGTSETLKLNGDQWEEIFLSIVELYDNLGHRNHVVRNLFSFQSYLRKAFPDVEFTYKKPEGFKQEFLPVDAEIMTEDEYQAVLASINRAYAKKFHASKIRIMRLMLMLGFRLGLRRREALYLSVYDFTGHKEVMVRIIKNVIRGLKTTNSKRKIPVFAFFEPEELEELLEWIEYRKKQMKEDPNDPGFLFAIPEFGEYGFREGIIINPLHTVMRAVTGRSKIRFHHLRHSAATWMTLRLFVADHDLSFPFFDHLPKTQAFLSRSTEFRKKIYRSYGWTRKHLWQVARILGHSGPDISIEHYIHCFDWVHAALMEKHKFWRKKDAAQASLLPTSSFYSSDQLEKNTYQNTLLKYYPCLVKLVQLRQNFTRKGLFPLRPPRDRWRHDNVWNAMNMREILHADAESIKAHTGFSEHEVDHLVAASLELSTDQQVGRVFRRATYPIKVQDEKLKTIKKERVEVNIPSKPRVNDDKLFARKVERKIAALDANRQIEIAELYIEEVHQGREWFDFQHGEQAKVFLRACQDLKVGKKYLGIELLPSSSEDIGTQLNYWNTVLKPNLKVGVKILTLESDTARGTYGTLRMRWCVPGQEEASPGLRFAFIMFLIISNFRETSNTTLGKR